MSVTRRYLLLPISHGSISIKFITVFAANVANGSVRYLLRRSAAAADRSFHSSPSLSPPLYFLLDPLYFPSPPRYYDPLRAYIRHFIRPRIISNGRRRKERGILVDYTRSYDWSRDRCFLSVDSSGDHLYLTRFAHLFFPGARFFFFFLILIGIIINCVIRFEWTCRTMGSSVGFGMNYFRDRLVTFVYQFQLWVF